MLFFHISVLFILYMYGKKRGRKNRGKKKPGQKKKGPRTIRGPIGRLDEKLNTRFRPT